MRFILADYPRAEQAECRWGCLKIRQAPARLAEELGAYSAPDRAAPRAARTYAESIEMESDLNGETHRDRFAIGAKRWL